MKKLLLIFCWCALPAFAQNNARMLSTPNAQTGTSYTFVAADTTRVTTFNNASPVAVTLPNGATQGFGAGTEISVVNLGAGAVTITCSACTINGSATLALAQNQGVDLYGGYGNPAVNYVAFAAGSGGGSSPAGNTGDIQTKLNPSTFGSVSPSSIANFATGDAVVYVSGSGNDANAGTQPNFAKATIPAAWSSSSCTNGCDIEVGAGIAAWAGGSVPANVRIHFTAAAQTVAMTGGVTLGANAQISCSGQSAGLSGQTDGTVLDWSGSSITGSTDLISASGNNSNDGVRVTGCYLKAGGKGRDGIHFSGVNGSFVAWNVIADPGRDGYRLDAGAASGSHSYDNIAIGNDVIHATAVGYHLIVNQGAGSNDIDRTTFLNDNYHPRDVGGVTSSGTAGWLLEVPSGSVNAQAIEDTLCMNCIVNGVVNTDPGVKLLVSQSGLAQPISDFKWLNGEVEDVYQSNTGTGLLISDTAASDVQRIWIEAPIGAGFTTDTNLSPSVAQQYHFSGFGVAEANRPQLNDFLTFVNTSSSTPALANGGLRFKTSNGNFIFTPTSDGLLHYFRTDGTPTDQFIIDGANQKVIPAANNTWSFGDAGHNWLNGYFGNLFVGTTLNLSYLSGTQCLHEISGVVSGTGSDCGAGGGGTPGGSTNSIQYNNAGAFGGIASSVTGQVPVFQNGGAPQAQSGGQPVRTVSIATDTVLCDSGTTLQDRGGWVWYATANTVTVPLPSNSGCGLLPVKLNVDSSAGSTTFNGAAGVLFNIIANDPTLAGDGVTAFTIPAGAWAEATNDGNTTWYVHIISPVAGTVQDGAGTTSANQLALTTTTAHLLQYSTALPNGTTATTQSSASNDTKVATDAYVDAHFIAHGTAALGTSAIAAGTCATVVTVSATGVATTDHIGYTPNTDPTAVTGYGPSSSGSLYIWAYPTANNVNFKVCNNTGGSITPGALTLNWRVAR